MSIGDLVICNCIANVWYRGLTGILIGFSDCTKDPMVMYGNGEVLRLARSGLEVIS
jgi:hypothetical protein